MLLPSGKASIGSTCNSGVDISTTPSLSEVDERPNLGMLALPLFTQGKRHVQLHSGFITLTGKVLSQVHHTFQPVMGSPVAMCSHKKKSRRNSNVLQESYSERESFLGIEKFAISLNCEQLIPLKEKKLLHQDSLKRNIIRDCFSRNTRITYRLSSIRVEYARILGRKRRQKAELSMTQASSLALSAWNCTKRIHCRTIAGERKIGSIQNWRKEKELFKRIV